jgi:hypothetical protein
MPNGDNSWIQDQSLLSSMGEIFKEKKKKKKAK